MPRAAQTDEQALKAFLLDISCLDRLAPWTSRFNVFDVLKATRAEIRHSNTLAWLLDPNENHGLGSAILEGFIQHTSEFLDDADVFSDLLMDLGDFTIRREWRNIDILAASASQNYVLVLENKIDSGEHSNQLARYRKVIQDAYSTARKRYIYLTPDGIEASDPEYWQAMSYQEVLFIIQNALVKHDIPAGQALLIENYLEVIRRDIVEDTELTRVCNEIYAKHRRAIDLIIQNLPNKTNELSAILKDWAAAHDGINGFHYHADASSRCYIRITTDGMSELFPDTPDALSAWNTPNHYFWEVVQKNGEVVYYQLCLCSRNMPHNQLELAERTNELYPCRVQKKNWLYRCPFITSKVKVSDDLDSTVIHAQLDEMLAQARQFEKDLIQRLSDYRS